MADGVWITSFEREASALARRARHSAREDEVETLVDGVHHDDASRERARGHWLQRQDQESATLAGLLIDHAERGAMLSVETVAGRSVRGRVESVGDGVICLALATPGERSFLRIAAITLIRPGMADGSFATGASDRRARSGVSFEAVLHSMSGTRQRALVVTTISSEAISGTVAAVGSDVVVLKADGPDAGPTFVPIHAITEVVLLERP